MKKLELLGHLVVAQNLGQKDAVHIATFAVKAGELLKPATHVYLKDGVAFETSRPNKSIGIVDPFLKNDVEENQIFNLCLYPGSITSLAHVWTHPLIKDSDNLPSQKQTSENWLRTYAIRMNTYDGPEEAYQRLLDGIRTNEVFAHGTDLHGLWELEDAEDLRYHASIVLGKAINWDDFTFSCSC